MAWLGAQGSFVEEVAEDAKGEDGHGESVACHARVSAGELGQDLVVVFWGRVLVKRLGEVRGGWRSYLDGLQCYI